MWKQKERKSNNTIVKNLEISHKKKEQLRNQFHLKAKNKKKNNKNISFVFIFLP